MTIPDVKTAILLLKSWGLETKGLRTKDQALQRLSAHWKAKAEEQEKLSNEKVGCIVKILFIPELYLISNNKSEQTNVICI